MDTPRPHDDILEYYGERFDEAARLVRDGVGRLELLRSQEILLGELPPAPADVLDVGGGPGVYARWLAGLGYRVHVVDPVPRHVEQVVAEGSCTAEVADARELTQSDGSFDVVLVMGPLYHLVERDERVRALSQARRVVRPGGLVAAAAISRLAPMLDYAALGWLGPENTERVARVARSGRHEPSLGFTVAYLHEVGELRDELADAGLLGARVLGVEGPAWPILRALDTSGVEAPNYASLFDAALEAARLADTLDTTGSGQAGEGSATAAWSSHLLAVARADEAP